MHAANWWWCDWTPRWMDISGLEKPVKNTIILFLAIYIRRIKEFQSEIYYASQKKILK